MIYLGDSPVGVAVDGKMGNFTKYEKKTLTFSSASNSNAWASNAIIPCSFEPKLIVFYGGDQEASGNIFRGVMFFSDGTNIIRAGGAYYKNAANGNKLVAGYNYDTNAGAVHFYYSSETGNAYINRVGANGYWSNTDSYTFEIYG